MLSCNKTFSSLNDVSSWMLYEERKAWCAFVSISSLNFCFPQVFMCFIFYSVQRYFHTSLSLSHVIAFTDTQNLFHLISDWGFFPNWSLTAFHKLRQQKNSNLCYCWWINNYFTPAIVVVVTKGLQEGNGEGHKRGNW